MLRSRDLCPTASECPEALNADQSEGLNVEPCFECPAIRLEEYLASPRGQMISLAIDLDFAVQSGISVTLADMSYLDFLLLRILNEERNKYQIEEMKKNNRG